jgi:hypothetical protein
MSAASDWLAFAAWLVEGDIHSISLNPNTAIQPNAGRANRGGGQSRLRHQILDRKTILKEAAWKP